MKKINGSVLQAGDVVLTTSTERMSKAIRFATRSDISHAMVCVESHSVIDATTEGVQARNVQRLIFEDECSIYILRSREPLSVPQINDICNYVRQAVGTEYTKTEAALTRLGGRADFSRKQFCSRLVAQAFSSIGIALVSDPNYCSPGDIKSSALLTAIEPSWLPFTAEEEAAWESNEDATQDMRDAINSVLKAARTKDGGIQSLNDVNQHLIDHPEDDAFILGAFRSSGYLGLWMGQKVKNPWLYDLAEMQKAPLVQMIEYCKDTLADEARGMNRFVISHGGYALLNKQLGLRTFAALEELYGILATGQRRRVDVARAFLEAKGLLEPEVLPVIRPHTPEWFAALEVWNPPQAMMTQACVAAMEGNLAVCSICGDDPATDYQLPPAHRTPAGVYTLRLCDDCLRIRRNMGEPYEKLPNE